MLPGSDIEGFEYVIFDSKGRRGIKDGREYPISDEDWAEAHPEHKNSGCKECTFFQDAETILNFVVPREMKERASFDPEFVGKFTLPLQTDHFRFYVFKCPSCLNVSVSHIYSIRRLGCLHCGYQYRLNPVRHREIIVKDRCISDDTLKHYIETDKLYKILNRQRPNFVRLFFILAGIALLRYFILN